MPLKVVHYPKLTYLSILRQDLPKAMCSGRTHIEVALLSEKKRQGT